MSEQWSPVPDYEGWYEVSSHGRVRSLTRCVGGRGGKMVRQGQMLTPRPDHEGYPYIGLRRGGTRRYFKVHALVLRAFVGARPEGMEARHLNGNRADARLSNLEWNTKAVNMADRDAHGGTVRGEKSPRSKLTSEQAAAIRNSPLPQRQLAAQYGVSKHAIYSIKSGRTWSTQHGI